MRKPAQFHQRAPAYVSFRLQLHVRVQPHFASIAVMPSVLLALGLSSGCSICQRVKEMSPDQRQLFFTLFGTIMSVSLLFLLLYHKLKAPLLPGIRAPANQLPFFGCLFPMLRGYHCMSQWRSEEIQACVEASRQAQLAYLLKSGADGSAVDRIQAPSLLQWSMPLHSAPFVDVISAPGIKHLLSDAFPSFEKGRVLRDALEELFHEGIFNTDGDSWRQQRKVASHMFSHASLVDKMFTVFSAESEKLVELLHTYVKTGETVDFQRLMHDFTFDSMCSIAFGVEMSQMGSHTPHAFCHSFDEAQRLAFARTISAPVAWKTLRCLNVAQEKQFRAHMKIVDAFIYQIVADRRASGDKFADSGDLLSLFLADAAKRGEELTDSYLRDVVLNFLVAGRDTTATALTWLFFEFDRHPQTQQRCAREVRDTLHPAVQTTPDHLKSLLHVESAFLETTRLWPPVPTDTKQCVADSSIFPCGTKITAGTILVYNPFALARLPAFYKSTSSAVTQGWAKDCASWNPERWIVKDAETGSDKLFAPSAYDFPSFNAVSSNAKRSYSKHTQPIRASEATQAILGTGRTSWRARHVLRAG